MCLREAEKGTFLFLVWKAVDCVGGSRSCQSRSCFSITFLPIKHGCAVNLGTYAACRRGSQENPSMQEVKKRKHGFTTALAYVSR